MSPLSDAFFTPLRDSAQNTARQRSCPRLSDLAWLELGLTRVLSDARSGRGFLQQLSGQRHPVPTLSHFFESLKSPRRLAILREVASRVAALLQSDQADRPELKAYELYAGDGHWHGAASHDAKPAEKRYAVGHLYALNLRTHALRHLGLCEGKKEHDMGAIKRLGAEALRLGTPKGRKVLWIWDRAGIDFRLWQHWKTRHGIYFISRTKENMKLEVMGENTIKADPINHGVVADDYVWTSQHMYVRRIRYQAPHNGETYEFITTEQTLEPGMIAWLYLRRWELEKVYDQFKNKLHEAKAWASSETAKQIQAELMCLAHNLLELFERKLAKEHQVANQAGQRRAEQRREKLKATASEAKRAISALLTEVIRPLQRSVKLLRWLRSWWSSASPLNESLEHLRRLYATP
jgi:Transposase DDE domain